MASLTLFSIPKPFRGTTAVQQRNAIASWRRLGESVGVILYGDDEGVAEASRDLGADHVAEVTKNDYGTPLLDGIFSDVATRARTDLIGYVNTDIVLLGDFRAALERIHFPSFLAVGRRCDLDLVNAIDFGDARTVDWLRVTARSSPELHPPAGSDFFVYPRATGWEMPAFAVGRTSWDNWLLFKARSRGLPVIDITGASIVIHQNHDYGHVAEGQGSWEGPETELNRQLMGVHHSFTLHDATHLLTEDGLKKPTGIRYAYRRLIDWLVLTPSAAPLLRVLDRVRGVMSGRPNSE